MLPARILLALLFMVAEPPQPTFDDLLGRLDGSAWLDREAATYELARVGSGVSVEQIEQRLEAGGLTLEQVVRLLRVVEIRLLHSPRGAVGIQMALPRPFAEGDPRLHDRVGVEVRAIIPNMPAEGLIEVGDIITHIGGEQLFSQEDLASVVQRHWPGDTLPFRVQRLLPAADGVPGESVEVTLDLVLGSTEQLTASSSNLSIRDPARSARRTHVNELQQRFGPVPTRVAPPVGGITTPRVGSEDDPVLEGVLQQLQAIESGRYPASLEQVRLGWLVTIERTRAVLEVSELEPAMRKRLQLRLDRLLAIYNDTAP